MNSEYKTYRMPEECSAHTRTWMGFPPDSNKIYGNIEKKLLNGLRMNIALIAKTISKYEPVNLIVDSNYDECLAKSYLDKLDFKSKYDILFVKQPINDIWLRDNGGTFVQSQDTENRVCVIDFNFNAWGKKQYCEEDKKVAQAFGDHLALDVLKSKLVLEGGGIEVDGNGTAILAESCILNKNRNQDKTKEDVEKVVVTDRCKVCKKFIFVIIQM